MRLHRIAVEQHETRTVPWSICWTFLPTRYRQRYTSKDLAFQKHRRNHQHPRLSTSMSSILQFTIRCQPTLLQSHRHQGNVTGTKNAHSAWNVVLNRMLAFQNQNQNQTNQPTNKINPFIHSSIHPSMHACMHEFHSFLHSFLHACMNFIHSPIHQCMHACMNFIHSCIHSCMHHGICPSHKGSPVAHRPVPPVTIPVRSFGGQSCQCPRCPRTRQCQRFGRPIPPSDTWRGTPGSRPPPLPPPHWARWRP